MDDLIERLGTAINSNSIGNGKIVVQRDLLEDALELLKSQQEKIKKYELDKSWEDSPDRMNGCGW